MIFFDPAVDLLITYAVLFGNAGIIIVVLNAVLNDCDSFTLTGFDGLRLFHAAASSPMTGKVFTAIMHLNPAFEL